MIPRERLRARRLRCILKKGERGRLRLKSEKRCVSCWSTSKDCDAGIAETAYRTQEGASLAGTIADSDTSSMSPKITPLKAKRKSRVQNLKNHTPTPSHP